MDKNGRAYEPPKVKIYQFDDNDLILTASGESAPTAEVAAAVLNDLFNTNSTTIEK